MQYKVQDSLTEDDALLALFASLSFAPHPPTPNPPRPLLAGDVPPRAQGQPWVGMGDSGGGGVNFRLASG